MKMDLHLALSAPQDLIQALYEASPVLEGFETRVSSLFASLLADPVALSQVPFLTASSNPADLPAPGSLVRFRAMVQDTGFGSEVYKAVGAKGEVLVYGIEEENGENEVAVVEDYTNLRERQAFYVVSVPGETGWVKEKLDGETSETSLAALSLSSESNPASALLANKFPIPSEPHFGCIAKVYGTAADAIKTCDVFEFLGILSSTPLSSPFDDMVSPTPLTTSIPALHVILTLPIPTPAPAPMDPSLRPALLALLAEPLGGDLDAAEWVLLSLLSRIHTRHPSGVALGSLSLNLSLPSTLLAPLGKVLSTLLPRLSELPLSIPLLNSPQTSLAPRNRDENLESGTLQLANGTTVLVDMRGVGEGKLEDRGVRNLRHLTTTIASQKLSYEFPYSSFDLETDLAFILLSEGKALVPTDCVVYVHPDPSFLPPPPPTPEVIDGFRSFLQSMREEPFVVPAEMSEIIQADYVERRQKSVGGEAMSQEDLLFRMTAARLMALSFGETTMGSEGWRRTAELDERRKERAVLPGATKGP